MVELEADNGELALGVFMSTAPVADNAERVSSVEVVAVDYSEGLMDDVFCHKDGVGCAPGLLPFRVESETGRNLV